MNKSEEQKLETPFDELIKKETFNVGYHQKELEGSKGIRSVKA